MELLGPSLDSLFTHCKHTFSLNTVLMLADQMIQRIEFLHSRHFLHRFIRPSCFLIGTANKQHILYLIKLSHCRRFYDPKGKQHIKFREGSEYIRSHSFASLNSHLGIEPSRRDDLESVGLVLLYFLKGSLPWSGVDRKRMRDKMLSTSIE